MNPGHNSQTPCWKRKIFLYSAEKSRADIANKVNRFLNF
jgi:hypothetical protein